MKRDPLRRIQVSETVRQMLEAATSDERAELLDMAAHYAVQFRTRFNRINGPSIAHSINLLIDDAFTHERTSNPWAKDIKCAPGCSNCCHLPVDISREEALLLHEAARNAGITLDDAALDARARWAFDDWHNAPANDRRCVFLTSESTCGVYEHRPSACRKYHVVSDPTLCDTYANPGARVQKLVSPRAEIIHVVAQSLSKERDTLPRMLLKYHPRRPKKKP